MRELSRYRKNQLIYLLVDIFSSELIWLCFLMFRWLVYEEKVFDVSSVLIPAFNFYKPLFFFPLGCVIIYYLCGFYLRPLKKKLLTELKMSLFASLLIGVGAFFIIVVDDEVSSYHLYFTSLYVLTTLSFVFSYLPRLCVTLFIRRKNPVQRSFSLHSMQELNSLIDTHSLEPKDEVIIDLPGKVDEKIVFQMINRLFPYNVEIAVVPRLFDMLSGAARIFEVEDVPLVRITDHKMSDMELCIKRAFDVTMSVVGLVVLFPLLLLLAILVYTTSKGPVFYFQERIGLHGVPFRIVKFRTMQVNAEEQVPQLSSDDDPRITAVGRIMRKYRLDELPQLWNVLRGEMSVVGPRPERQFFIQQIQQQAPYYCLLYKVRPGLTSWGPVKVGYTDTLDKMIRRLNFDIVYMENMSLGLDIKILFYTIGVIVDGKGK